MDAKQRVHLERVLKEMLGEIEELLKQQDERAEGELSSVDNHPADSASDLVIETTEMAIEEFREDEVEEIKAALQAMKDGTYGICAVCEQDIPYERLEALPTATTCVEHAE